MKIIERINEKELVTTIKELADFKFALDQSSIVAIIDQKGKITYALVLRLLYVGCTQF